QTSAGPTERWHRGDSLASRVEARGKLLARLAPPRRDEPKSRGHQDLRLEQDWRFESGPARGRNVEAGYQARHLFERKLVGEVAAVTSKRVSTTHEQSVP